MAEKLDLPDFFKSGLPVGEKKLSLDAGSNSFKQVKNDKEDTEHGSTELSRPVH